MKVAEDRPESTRLEPQADSGKKQHVVPESRKTEAISAVKTTPTPVTTPESAKKSDIKHKLIHFDRFEYDISREHDSSSYQTFRKHGWSNVKAVNITGSHAGYLYTVERIPGYSGNFPGQKSRKVLAIEARAGSMNTQTDFYLQYGDEHSPDDTIPGNVWFQFWIYPNRYNGAEEKQNQKSAFAHRFKFIYPCKSAYPCTIGNIHWLYTMGYISNEPYWKKAPDTELFISTVDPFNTTVRHLRAPKWDQFKIGQTDLSEHIVPNRWTLVKLHYDTSTSSGRFEAWLKPLGGQWTKVAEWIDGHTPDFEWKIAKHNIGGHRAIRIPTTLDSFDSWLYLDDFAMATSEEALPHY